MAIQKYSDYINEEKKKKETVLPTATKQNTSIQKYSDYIKTTQKNDDKDKKNTKKSQESIKSNIALTEAKKNYENAKSDLKSYLENNGVVTGNNMYSIPNPLTVQKNAFDSRKGSTSYLTQDNKNDFTNLQQADKQNMQKFNEISKTQEANNLYQNVKEARNEKSKAQSKNDIIKAQEDYNNSSDFEKTLREISSPVRGAMDMIFRNDNIIQDKDGRTYTLPNYLESMNKEISEGAGWLGKVVNDVGYQGGKLAVSSALNSVVPGLGTTMYSADMFLDTYDEALREGYTEKQASTYAIINTGLEYVTQKLLGAGVGRFKGDSPFEDLIGEKLKKVVKSETINKLLSTMASEGTEEFVQEYLDQINRNITLGEDEQIFTAERLKQAGYSALIGALSSGATQGSGIMLGNNIQNNYEQIVYELEKENNTNLGEEEKALVYNIMFEQAMENDGVINPSAVKEYFNSNEAKTELVNSINESINTLKQAKKETESKKQQKKLDTQVKELKEQLDTIQKQLLQQGTNKSIVSLEEQLEKQGTRIMEEAESKKISMIDNFKNYLEENNITNPTQQDIDNSIIDLLGYDNELDYTDTLKEEKLYNQYVREYMQENGIPFNNEKTLQEQLTNSKVRDDNGDLIKVFHGTDANFENYSNIKTEPGFWFTEDKEYAQTHGKNLKEQYLNLTNPIDDIDLMWKLGEEKFGKNVSEKQLFSNEFKNYLIEKGYDGIVFDHSGKNTYIAFYPEQIIDIVSKPSQKDIKLPNPENDEIGYSKETKLPFDKQVDLWAEGKWNNKSQLVLFKQTPQLYLDLGLNNNPITVSASKMDRIVNDSGNQSGEYHGLGIETVKQLPEAISNPLNILESSTVDDSIVVVTELSDKQGRIVIVSMKIDGKGRIELTDVNNRAETKQFPANVMTSAYGRNNYENWMNQNRDKIIYDIDDGIIKKRIDGEWLRLPKDINSSVSNNTINLPKSQIVPLPNNSNMQNNEKNILLPSARVQNEINEMEGLKAADEAFGLNEEETKRLETLSKKYDKDYVTKKKFESAEKKVLTQATKEAKNNLGLTAKESKEFKEKLQKLTKNTKEELTNELAKNDVKKIISDYSERTITHEDSDIVDVKRQIRNQNIKVSDYLKNQITDYGDFKKRNFGKLKLTKEGIPVDAFYAELANSYPGYFDKDVISDADILETLADFMNKDTSYEESLKLSDEEINDITNKVYNKLLDNSLTLDEIDNIDNEIYKKAMQQTRKAKISEYKEKAANYTYDTINWKDIPLIKQKTNTMKRNLRMIMPLEQANAMYNEYFAPISENNAKIEREITKYNDRISNLNLNNRESTAVQMLGELKYNPDTKLTSEEVYKYINDNKLNKQKVDNAIETFRKTYDELFTRVNEVLREQGYKEIDYRKGYFPHFNEEHGKTMIGKIAEKLGWKFNSNKLPTDIAGITEQFKPGKKWTTFTQRRTGDITDYNALKGFDNYVRGAMQLIYHTEDIQKLRGLENQIRYQHSEKGLQEKIDSITNNQNLTSEEKQDQIDLTFKDYNNELANFVTNLRDYTNNLAGKKSVLDRSAEQLLDRRIYNVMDNVSSRVSANMVGGNLSSAFTNFIPVTQAWSQIKTKNMLKGMLQTITNQAKNDNFVDRSTYLTNRKNQADRLYKTNLQKFSEKATSIFEAIDGFTSETIVRGKYLENIENGMSEQQAMKNANEFAKDVMAGRSQGDMPTIFNSKSPVTRLFTAFQLEVNNQYGYMFKDLPIDLKDKALKDLAVAFFKMFLGAWLYNKVAEELTGRKSAFSPFDIAEETLNIATRDDLSTYDKLSKTTKNITEELPFISGLVGGGRLPISGAIPDIGNTIQSITNLGDEEKRGSALKTLEKELSKPFYYVALPFGGGQLKKAKEGLSMYNKNLPVAGSYTDSGNLRFKADESTAGKVKAALFGQYANKEAKEYIDSGYKTVSQSHIKEMQDLDMSSSEYVKYRKNLNNSGTTNSEKINYVVDSNYTDKQKNIMAKNILNEKEDKYLTSSQIADNYYDYAKWSTDISEIRKATSNDKEETINYINELPLSIPQKALFIKTYYKSFKQYDNEIINYIVNQKLTIEEKSSILLGLGYKIRNGKVYTK